MICPQCNRSFDQNAGPCPRCAAEKGVVKTSTILISSGGLRNVYRSVEEVPDRLKKQLIRSTNGLNSATIVIADRQGRKEIAKTIRNLPAGASRPPGEGPMKPPSCPKLNPEVLRAAGLVLLLAVAALVWYTFRPR